MTPFETASLAAAQDTLSVLRWQAWAAEASVIVAFVAAAIAIPSLRNLTRQVKEAAQANSIGQLNALLAIEQDMSRRRDRLSELGTKVQSVKESPEYKANAAILEIVISQYNESKENYLNSLDRLCFCILRGKFSEDELRADYREVIRRAITDFKDDFGTGTAFRNVRKVYERWADT
jgi:uncharacterized membrane protein YfbV (UPF0208 family)